jgi:dTDP-4-dehydrorhamnose reductase
VLGTRLAVFMPLPRLRLIIVDEEHDASFKQQEGLRYSARDVAVWRGHQLDIPVVLGSATPSLETFHHAGTGRYQLLGLPERAVAEANPDALTVRVCWVFSGFANNFVSKLISLARDAPSLQIVDDQVGPPTFAPDVASALLRIAGAMRGAPGSLSGLLHLAAPDEMDRAAMARAIMAESRRQGGPFAAITGISSTTYAAAAHRPLNARLSGALATQMFALSWTPWPEALERSVAAVLARN